MTLTIDDFDDRGFSFFGFRTLGIRIRRSEKDVRRGEFAVFDVFSTVNVLLARIRTTGYDLAVASICYPTNNFEGHEHVDLV